MAGFFSDLLRALREGRGSDMRFLCGHLLSERGEASQTALAQEIITAYQAMTQAQRLSFFAMLCNEFSPDAATILRAAADYQESPDAHNLAKLAAAVESPRQELLRRINTAPHGTEVLVALREHVQQASSGNDFSALDTDLKQLFRSWFNRGFLRLERISWQTSAAVLEKLIRYESVHEINGWPDLQRRLEADRRCFAFFHSALPNEPIIFVEVALARGLTGDMGPLLDIETPVLPPERATTALFYSINNCRDGLRGIPFGNFLIKQVVTDLAAELPKIKIYSTLSPLPRFARALKEALSDQPNVQGFTRDRLCRLVTDFAAHLTAAAGCHDSVEALFRLLDDPLAHRDVLDGPLERLALAYIAQARQGGRLYDPVAIFHLSNGARLERINAFGIRRSYGLEASFGVTVNYRYLPDSVEENHERFVRHGQIRVSSNLYREYRIVAEAWRPAGIRSSVRVTH